MNKIRFILIVFFLSLVTIGAFFITTSTVSQSSENVYLPLLSISYWPNNSLFLGSTGGFSSFLLANNNLAFFGNGNHMMIFDSSSGGDPQFLSEVALPGPPTSAQVSGELVFTTTGYGGLVVLDISHPELAKIAGILQVPGFSSHVLVVDKIAYLSTSQAFLTLDVSNPNDLTVLDVEGNPSSLSFHNGNLVYYGDYGVHILDVSDPAHPITLGEYPDGKFLTVSGELAFTVTEPGCYPFNCMLYINTIDVSDPANPQLLGTHSIDKEIVSEYTIHAGLAYITSSEVLDIYSITEAGDWVRLGGYEAGGSIYSLSFAGNLLILGIDRTSIEILDINDPTEPELVSTYSASNLYCITVQFADNRLFCRIDISDDYYIDDAALQVIDFTSFTQPVLSGDYYVGPGINALKTQIENDRLYLVGSNTEDFHNNAPGESINSFLMIYDIENPDRPTELGVYDLEEGISFPELARSFQIEDEIGYIRTYQAAGWLPPNLEIVDLHNPAQPSLIARYSGPYFGRFRVIDDYIYMLAEEWVTPDNSFQILDISNPLSITLVSSLIISPTYSLPQDFAINNNFAYIGVSGNGSYSIHIIDISDPILPDLSSIYTLTNITSSGLEAIEISDNLAIVGFTGYLQLLDITDPLAPEYLSNVEICGEIVDIQIVGNRAYIACRGSGAQVIDISDPYHPSIIQKYEGTITGINTGADQPIYLSGFDDGLLIYDHHPPAVIK